jgi:hypothetical protein
MVDSRIERLVGAEIQFPNAKAFWKQCKWFERVLRLYADESGKKSEAADSVMGSRPGANTLMPSRRLKAD